MTAVTPLPDAFERQLRARLTVPTNPLKIIGDPLAWRSVWYCLASIGMGLAALVAGVLGLFALPGVARRTAAVERGRVRALGLPRLAPAERGSGAADVGVWAVTVLFGLVDLVIGAICALLVVAFLLSTVNNLAGVFTGRLDGIAAGLFLWFVLTVALYVGWALAAAQAWWVHQILRPYSDLSAQLAAVTVSRAELLRAHETERRRIERDLHDGAQQHLVLLSMQLGQARFALDAGRPEVAAEALDRAQEEAEASLRTLRETVRGIHPQVLTDHGLVAAAHDLAGRQPLPVEVEATGTATRLPAPIENAVYFVIAEALTNVVKHAGATHARVRLELGEWVRVEVGDDGDGGARVSPGSGLAGLAERVATLGGTLVVESPPGGPTTVSAGLPGSLR